MNTIFKYGLELKGGEQIIQTPRGAIVRHFGMQNGDPFIWCEVDSLARETGKKFLIVGTGHPIPEGAIYHSTCFHGDFVWHLFEMIV